MASSDPLSPAPRLGTLVLDRIATHGSPPERQLVAPHADVIRRFLDHPDVQPFGQRTKLDIGLENQLTLKLNLIATRRASPWAMIDQFAEWAPSLRNISETVIRHRLHCHAGIKVTRDGVEYELYPYETPNGLLARSIDADLTLDRTGLPAAPYCFGLSSTGTLSAYAQIEKVPASELEEAAGFPIPAQGLRTRALFHSRRGRDGLWVPGKAGIEFLPFPSHLLNQALRHLNLHFSYLLHRGGLRTYGVIGLMGTRQVLYTTMFPRPERPTRPQGDPTGEP